MTRDTWDKKRDPKIWWFVKCVFSGSMLIFRRVPNSDLYLHGVQGGLSHPIVISGAKKILSLDENKWASGVKQPYTYRSYRSCNSI